MAIFITPIENYYQMTIQTEKQHTAPSDEIDLVELLSVLWAKKWWIILFTFISTVFAGIYAFTAKEEWTSKAEIVSPNTVELGNYLTLRKEYARILGEEFDVSAFAGNLYHKFERLSYSLDVREAFLANSEIYKQLTEDKNEAEKRKLLNKLARENISITKPDAKKDPNAIGRKYAFSAETAMSAQKTLTQFIDYVNQEAFNLDLQLFGVSSREKLADLKFEYEKIKRDLTIQKKVKLENLSTALDTAGKADVKEYSKVLNNNSNMAISSLAMSDAKIPLSDSKLSDSTYLFMLGEKYLKAQIDTAKQMDVIYPPRFYEIEDKLKKLESLFANAKKVKATTFAYLSSPDYPVVKDKPKKLIILLIGMVLGLLLSSGGILVSRVFKK